MEFIEKQKMPEFIHPSELIKGKCFFKLTTTQVLVFSWITGSSHAINLEKKGMKLAPDFFPRDIPCMMASWKVPDILCMQLPQSWKNITHIRQSFLNFNWKKIETTN